MKSTFHNTKEDMGWVHTNILNAITPYRSALVYYKDDVPEVVYLFNEEEPNMTQVEHPDEVWAADPYTHMMKKRGPNEVTAH